MKINYLIQTILFSAVFCATFTSIAFSQSLKPNERIELVMKISDFVNNTTKGQETINTTTKNLEAFLLILKIDSAGKVGDIQLMTGDRFRDTLYGVFKKMTKADFQNWVSEGCKNKTIMIPIIRIDKFTDFNYINEVAGLRAFKPRETGKIIILREIDFGWSKTIECPVISSVPVNLSEKNN